MSIKALTDIRDSIDEFYAECETDEYTDIGDAWDLFGTIKDRCEMEMKNIIDTESGGLRD